MIPKHVILMHSSFLLLSLVETKHGPTGAFTGNSPCRLSATCHPAADETVEEQKIWLRKTSNNSI
jgi:hypothetical protein